MPRSRDELSRLAETLNEMLARLEAAFEHERRFVDDASHELRTPLALLRTELELALRHPRSREELERALRSAAEDTERLSRLAEDLLLFARVDEGRLPLRCVEVDAEEAARRRRRTLRVAGARGRTRALRVDVCRRSEVDADPARIEQALGNLVENALAYGAGAVVLSARAEDGRVELHVTDEGPGVPPDFLPRAFDRFSRADEARGGGGTGLGLAIVDLIARAHDGERRPREPPGSRCGRLDQPPGYALRGSRLLSASPEPFICLSSGPASLGICMKTLRPPGARSPAATVRAHASAASRPASLIGSVAVAGTIASYVANSATHKKTAQAQPAPAVAAPVKRTPRRWRCPPRPRCRPSSLPVSPPRRRSRLSPRHSPCSHPSRRRPRRCRRRS